VIAMNKIVASLTDLLSRDLRDPDKLTLDVLNEAVNGLRAQTHPQAGKVADCLERYLKGFRGEGGVPRANLAGLRYDLRLRLAWLS
jgi:hypothetical protein